MQGYADELDKTGGMMGDLGHKVVDGTKSLGNKAVAGVTNLIQKPINTLKDKMTDTYNNSLPGQVQSGLDNLGNIASSIAPLGLAAMMGGGMMGGGTGPQGQTINNYYGSQGSKPTIFNQSKASVGSLSSPSIKTSGLVDTVAGVVRNRAINNLIDKSVASEDQAEGTPEAAEKEVEITSKYPEMSKLLEDEQNKAYLQKLLKN